MTVNLTGSPNSDDGALLLEVKGPSVRTVTAKNPSLLVYADTTSTTSVRTVVAGNLTTGGLFTFQVPAGSSVSAYSVTLVEISNRQNQLRNGSSGYTLTITP